MIDEAEIDVESLCSKILEKARHYDSLFDKARIQTIRVKAQQKLTDLERLRKLKDEHRELENDLRRDLLVKTCKDVKHKNTQESISATKARIEELKRIVQDQNARDDRIAELMPQQLHDVDPLDNTDRKNVEAALLWYRNVLGFRTEGGEGVKFFFSKIDHKNPDKEFSFTIRLEGDTYKLLNCDPVLRDTPTLIKELNETNSFFKFVRAMREKFLAYALYEFPPPTEDIYQKSSSIILSSPPISDSMSGSSHSKIQHSSGNWKLLEKSPQPTRRRSPRLQHRRNYSPTKADNVESAMMEEKGLALLNSDGLIEIMNLFIPSSSITSYIRDSKPELYPIIKVP